MFFSCSQTRAALKTKSRPTQSNRKESREGRGDVEDVFQTRTVFNDILSRRNGIEATLKPTPIPSDFMRFKNTLARIKQKRTVCVFVHGKIMRFFAVCKRTHQKARFFMLPCRNTKGNLSHLKANLAARCVTVIDSKILKNDVFSGQVFSCAMIHTRLVRFNEFQILTQNVQLRLLTIIQFAKSLFDKVVMIFLRRRVVARFHRTLAMIWRISKRSGLGSYGFSCRVWCF